MSNNEHECCGKHNHDEGQGCGCDGHDHHHHDHESAHEDVIYLTTDDGEEMACNVLGVFDYKDDEYIALLPEKTETVFIYGFKEIDEEIDLTRIEDEELYKNLSDVFMKLWEEEGDSVEEVEDEEEA